MGVDSGESMKLRRVERYSVQLPARLHGDGSDLDCTVVNLSVDGCAVLADRPFAVGSYVRIDLDLGAQEPPLEIELSAVRWRAGSRFGCEFIKVQEVMKSRLAEFVRLLETPASG